MEQPKIPRRRILQVLFGAGTKAALADDAPPAKVSPPAISPTVLAAAKSKLLDDAQKAYDELETATTNYKKNTLPTINEITAASRHGFRGTRFDNMTATEWLERSHKTMVEARTQTWQAVSDYNKDFSPLTWETLIAKAQALGVVTKTDIEKRVGKLETEVSKEKLALAVTPEGHTANLAHAQNLDSIIASIRIILQTNAHHYQWCMDNLVSGIMYRLRREGEQKFGLDLNEDSPALTEWMVTQLKGHEAELFERELGLNQLTSQYHKPAATTSTATNTVANVVVATGALALAATVNNALSETESPAETPPIEPPPHKSLEHHAPQPTVTQVMAAQNAEAASRQQAEPVTVPRT